MFPAQEDGVAERLHGHGGDLLQLPGDAQERSRRGAAALPAHQEQVSVCEISAPRDMVLPNDIILYNKIMSYNNENLAKIGKKNHQ